jgi:ribosomal-protein-alanine N-acetyltransferase
MLEKSQSPYFLSSERIGFRWWTKDDSELARELWGDPEVTRLFSKMPFSNTQVQERLRSELECASSDGIQYWPIFDIATGQHIGCAGLRPWQPAERIFEMGYHLRPAHWGKGYATEAGKLILKYGIQNCSASAIIARHHPENFASKNVLLKLRFESNGADFYEPTGLMHPSYIFHPPKQQT